MIASWMLYTLFVSLAAALAVAGLEAAGRSLRLPTRHVWAAGMAACALLSAAGLWRAAAARLALPAPAGTPLPAGAGIAAAADESLAATLLDAAREAVTRAAASVGGVGTGVGFWVLAGGWAALTAALLAIGVVTLRRFRRGRRGWPLRAVAGRPVRVAPAAGPAVVGLLHPEIVVPEWLLDEPAEHQRMVVLHEDEHIRGRDPLLAGLGFALAALMPWNPVMWWLLRGMRWAAEVDCDSRVLRHDVPARAYGSLLIDLAGRTPRYSFGVSHLSESSAALKRRLQAMTARIPSWARTRAVALGALSALALVGACEAKMPTSAEIDAMDATHAEARARDLHLISGTQETLYTIDGRAATAEQARALPASSIATVNVEKPATGTARVMIVTTAGAAAAASTDAERAVVAARASAAAVSPNVPGNHETLYTIDGRPATAAEAHALASSSIVTVNVEKPATGVSRVSIITNAGAVTPRGADAEYAVVRARAAVADGTPLIVIDGRRTDENALKALRPEQIESVEVIKGPAARQRFNDLQEGQGAIVVTTKTGARR
jgi:hypothetical protein